jgi:tripartite-type tricarboxylate transporter receptor subunit TctC
VTTIWLALFVPVKTPKPVIDKLNQALMGIMQQADVKDRFTKLGMQAAPLTPPELDQMLRKELAMWTRVVKENNIKPE